MTAATPRAQDQRFMTAALELARRGLGGVWPNPAVGCVIVRDGVVAGRGWTQPGGRPHAETEALKRAGEAARGATAYVSLEPCSHHGKTPPCAEALIAAGITRCVVACGDPDPRVSGRGIAALRAAGIAVDTGLLAAEARAVRHLLLQRDAEEAPRGARAGGHLGPEEVECLDREVGRVSRHALCVAEQLVLRGALVQLLERHLLAQVDDVEEAGEVVEAVGPACGDAEEQVDLRGREERARLGRRRGSSSGSGDRSRSDCDRGESGPASSRCQSHMSTGAHGAYRSS